MQELLPKLLLREQIKKSTRSQKAIETVVERSVKGQEGRSTGSYGHRSQQLHHGCHDCIEHTTPST